MNDKFKVLRVQTYYLQILNMHCQSCVNTITKVLDACPGISDLQVDLVTHLVQFTLDEDKTTVDIIIKKLKKAGYAAKQESLHPLLPGEGDYSSFLVRASVALSYGLLVFILTMTPMLSYVPYFNEGLLNTELLMQILAVTTALVLYGCGRDFYIRGIKGLLMFNTNMDTLIALSTGSAYVFSVIGLLFPDWFKGIEVHTYYESAVVIIGFVNLGAYLEHKARNITYGSLRKLISLQPKTACRVEIVDKSLHLPEHKGYTESQVPIESIEVKDLIRVRPGEQIPIDGVIIQGESSVDEASLTGESMWTDKFVGDTVLAGTMNKTGSFLMEASTPSHMSVLAKVIETVQKSQHAKPQIAKLGDKVAMVFVPLVLLIAIVSSAIWYAVGPEPKVAFMLTCFMNILIIACPCAVGLASPISVMVSIGNAAQKGILIKNEHGLDAREITTLVVDKTGTLTTGRAHVAFVTTSPMSHQAQVLQLAASIEQFSEHSLSHAIIQLARTHNLPLLEVEAFEAYPGLGLKGNVINKEANKDGKQVDKVIDKVIERVLVGNTRFMLTQGIDKDNMAVIDSMNDEYASLANTLVYVVKNESVIGAIALSDSIKEDSKEAIELLKQQGIQIYMLTGDNYSSAKAVAGELGIKKVYAQLLPQDKVTIIEGLIASGETVGMVGDGLNDAPSLVRAHVSYAMAQGSDISIESADVSLLKGSMMDVYETIKISQKMHSNIKQNFWGAFIYNLCGIPIAAGVLYPHFGLLLDPMIASLIMALSSVTVVLNANRLRNQL